MCVPERTGNDQAAMQQLFAKRSSPRAQSCTRSPRHSPRQSPQVTPHQAGPHQPQQLLPGPVTAQHTGRQAGRNGTPEAWWLPPALMLACKKAYLAVGCVSAASLLEPEDPESSTQATQAAIASRSQGTSGGARLVPASHTSCKSVWMMSMVSGASITGARGQRHCCVRRPTCGTSSPTVISGGPPSAAVRVW
jgi:hypothetical protein